MIQWQEMEATSKFNMKKIYYGLMEKNHSVPWKKLFFDNDVRPSARYIIW